MQVDGFELMYFGKPPSKMESIYELNCIEKVLQNVTRQGLSMKKLKELTKLPKRTIKYHVYNSKFIENTNPWIHGSGKTKIQVFNYTPVENNYFKRKKRNIFEECNNVLV